MLSAIIFAFTYVAFSFGRVPGLRSDRVAAAIVGGVLLVALGVLSWLTLAMASTLAGNLTLPGSLATVIVAERAKRESPISFLDFIKVGVPSALASLAIGAAWLTFGP